MRRNIGLISGIGLAAALAAIPRRIGADIEVVKPPESKEEPPGQGTPTRQQMRHAARRAAKAAKGQNRGRGR